MKIYFVRHGKTEWNLEQRYQGAHGDSPLLPQSMTDLKELSNYLKDEKFAAVYASPLKRAKISGQLLADQVILSLIVDERLKEFDLGKLEGMDFAKAAEKYPEETDNFFNHPAEFDATKIASESYQDVIDRGEKVIAEIRAKYQKPDDQVLVVSHGAFLVALIGSLLGYPISDLRQNGGLANTSLTIVDFSPTKQNGRLIKWNDTEFLSKKLSETDTI